MMGPREALDIASDLPATPAQKASAVQKGFADLPAPAAPRGLADVPGTGASADARGITDLPAPAVPRASIDTQARTGQTDDAFSDLPSLSVPRRAADIAPPPPPASKSGFADLPAPAAPRGAGLPQAQAPAPATTGLADLPSPAAPRKGLVDLTPAAPTAPPAPKGLADLPSPAKPAAATKGLADLPSPAAPATTKGLADLPSPAARAATTKGLADLPSPAAPAAMKGFADLPSPAAPKGFADLPVPAGPKSLADLPTPAERSGLPAVAASKDAWRDPPPPATAPPGFGDLDFDAPEVPARSPVASIDLHALDDLPSPSGVGLPSARAMDSLDDPFARGLDSSASNLPTPRHPDLGTDLPTPRAPDLPSPKGTQALGRVILEKRAVPASSLEATLPAAARAVGLPAAMQSSGLPATASGAGLPSPSVTSGLPATASNVGLPSPYGNAGLPSPLNNAGLPSPMAGGDTGGFGELELPMGEELAITPAQRRTARGVTPVPPAGEGAEFDLPLPPPPESDDARGRKQGGGMGFGELSLGDESDPSDAQPRGHGGADDEFGEIPMERAKGASSASSGSIETAIPARAAATVRTAAPVESKPVKPASRKGLYIALGTVGALVIGGAALSMTSAGPFGANIIDEKLNGPARHAAARRAIDTARADFEHDTFGRARHALRTLDAQLDQTPAEHDLSAYDTYAHYFVLARFGNDSAVAGRARTLFERMTPLPPTTQFLNIARSARELSAGRAEAARRGLAGNDPVVRDLRLMAQLDGADPAAAVETARLAASAPRATSRARFLYVRALYLADDHAGAQREAEALLSVEPEHAGARLLLARVLAERVEGRPRAIILAGEVEAAVRDASNDERTEAAVLIGQTELARDHVTQAREAFERAMTLDPRSGAALNGAGSILYRQSSFQEALARFQAAQTADPEDLDAKVGIAMSSVALSRPGDARQLLEPLLADHGSDARVHYWLAKALLAMHENGPAEREFREAIRLDSANLDAYTTLASLLFSLQRPDSAEQVLEGARAHVTDQASIHRALGEGRAARGDLPSAEAELRLAIAARPDDLRSHFILSQTLRRLGRFADAQHEIDVVARTDAEYPGLLLERGTLAEARGDAAGALAMFRAASTRDPQNSELVVRVSAALVATEQYAEADAQMTRFLNEHPNNAEAHFVLGRAKLAQSNMTDAVRLLERATELDATRADFRAYAAEANLNRANFSRALEHANQAISIDVNYARGYWVRGEVRVRSGQVAQGLMDANQALRLDPQFAEANVTLADADEALQHVPEAIILYRRALQLRPTRGDWHARLGRLLGDQGSAAESIASLQRAASLGDPISTPPSWLAPAHRQLGDLLRERDRAGARRHYQRFIELSTPASPGVSEVRAALMDLGR